MSHTVKYTKEKGVHISTQFKNIQSKRIVPIPRWLTPELKEILNTNEYPFLHLYTTLGRLANEYMDLANMKKIRIHDFHHSYASMLINKNVDI